MSSSTKCGVNKEDQGASSLAAAPPPLEGVDFLSLPWNLNLASHHCYVHITTESPSWSSEHYDATANRGSILSSVKPYASTSLPLFPATTSLNYGTTIWEGLKCYRTSPTDAVVFRPDRNYHRFVRGAQAMCLPPPSYELFMAGIQTVIRHNAALIPPPGEGMKLYVRPMLLASGQQLGLHLSKQYTLLFYVSPTGSYFQAKHTGLKLHLETNFSRAARGGLGNVKCCGNYAVTMRPLQICKPYGLDDNLYLELDTYQRGQLGNAIIQELSASNIFLLLQSGELVTPCLKRGTILPGVTRDSVLALAKEYNQEVCEAFHQSTTGGGGGGESSTLNAIQVSERDVTVSEFHNAIEAFVTGTAAEIVPVASVKTIAQEGEEPFVVVFKHGAELPGGPVTEVLTKILREVMVGKRVSDVTKTWLRDPFASYEEFRSASD